MKEKQGLKKELSQLYSIGREIEMQKKQLLSLKRDYMATSHSLKVDSVEGSAKSFPYIFHSISVEGLSDDDLESKLRIKLKFERITKLLRTNQGRFVNEYDRLIKFIQKVDDSEMRQILTYKYISNLPWNQVAANISINATDDSVRKAHDRFIEKYENLSDMSVFNVLK